jgi:replication initiation protein RepC
MPIVRTVRRDLGLSTGDLLVLSALLSFLPCKDRETGAERPVGPDMVLVVFAGNAALCERANGMDERCLRRHLSRLADAGLIRRKQSATGKRFPLKRDGVIRDAFGIDLTPLLTRHTELADMASEARRRAEEIKALRAEALAIRARALETADPADQETWSFLDQVKTILRRATLTAERVRDLITALTKLVYATEARSGGAPYPTPDPEPPVTRCAARTPTLDRVKPVQDRPAQPSASPAPHPVGTAKTPGGSGQNVRQLDPYQIDIKKRDRGSRLDCLWRKCRYLATFREEPPRTERALLELIHEFGRLARFDDRMLAEGVRALGPYRLLEVLDHIAGHAQEIRCRYSYLTRAMQRERINPS